MNKNRKRLLIALIVMVILDVIIAVNRLLGGVDIASVIFQIALIDVFLILACFGYIYGLKPMLDGVASGNPERMQHSLAIFSGGIFALGEARRRKEVIDRNNKE